MPFRSGFGISECIDSAHATIGTGGFAITDIPRTVADLGEFAVIDRITRGRQPGGSEVVGPGDDAAVIAAADGRFVVTTDMLVQDRHFRLDWSSSTQIGRKAVAQNASDIAAMGAAPTAFVVALGCPPDTELAFLDQLRGGMDEEARRAGGAIVGGDLVQCEQLVVSVTAHGDLRGRAPVLRSGARPGQIVAVAGELGRSAAGYALLVAGRAEYPELVATHLVPRPPYDAGLVAVDAGATAMIDTSDGLLSDLGHISAQSGVAIDISPPPVDPMVADAARLLGVDPLHWTLTGGEDHALVAVFASAAEVPTGWRPLGTTAEGSGVRVDGRSWDSATGWRSF